MRIKMWLYMKLYLALQMDGIFVTGAFIKLTPSQEDPPFLPS